MRVINLCMLVALAAAGASAQIFANDFNFFPAGAHPGCGNGDCSFPEAWFKVNQTEYPALGNKKNGVLKIAVSDYFPAGPTLYVIPGAWCDTSGAIADGNSNGLRPWSSHKRKLSGAGGPTVEVNGGATCTIVGKDPVSFKVGDGEPQVATRAGNGAYKIPLPNNMPDGETCVEVSAIYDTSKVKTSPPYEQFFQPLGEKKTVFSRKVCLYKLTKQADATINFDMCTSNKFTLNISEVSPLPVNISLFDKPLPFNLFRPMIKLWGNKVSELDGHPVDASYDESSSRSEANYIAKFIPINAGYDGSQLSIPLSEKLQEGYYQVSAVISVITRFPALTNLTGLNQIAQDDESGTRSNVTGLFEAASRLIHNNTVVGVQKNSTLTTLSAISSSSHAAGKSVEAGDKIVLNWKFRGIGSAECTHDGQPVSNAPNGKCVPPLTITAKDFGSAKTKHKVAVTFTDVCGRERGANFEYTQQGVKTLSQTEVLNDDGSIKIVGGASRDSAKGNAAGGLHAGAGVAMGVAAGALTLLAL